MRTSIRTVVVGLTFLGAVALGVVLTVKATPARLSKTDSNLTVISDLGEPHAPAASTHLQPLKVIGTNTTPVAGQLKFAGPETPILRLDISGSGGGSGVTSSTPEPATLLLLGTGLFGLAAGVRRKLASRK